MGGKDAEAASGREHCWRGAGRARQRDGHVERAEGWQSERNGGKDAEAARGRKHCWRGGDRDRQRTVMSRGQSKRNGV